MKSGAWREAWLFAAAALAARLAVVAWAAHARFPAVEDGHFYDTLARRLASGAGYTWLWPDGAVTNAAHYPVGYPALLGAVYGLFGASPVVAGIMNAAIGSLGVFAAYRLLDVATTRTAARIGTIVFALHPALLAYTPAVMTEGVTASLVVVAVWLASDARASTRPWAWHVLAGVALGVATLVRPQSLLVAPALGALAFAAGAGWKRRAGGALVVSAIAIACCLPWTARNCAKMDRCALVSMNGGWNLLIGARSTRGGWAPVEPPPEACREVWSESQKDLCFERAARAEIANDPRAWLAKAPAKLGATFDYFGAAPWYLHASNAIAFPDRAKTALGSVETVVARLLLLVALLRVAMLEGPRTWPRRALAAAGAIAVVMVHAWIAYLVLAAAIALLGRRRLAELPLLVPWTAVIIAATALTHAAFFGAGRYGLVVVPFVTALAFVGRTERASPMPPL